jgi:hypothetical protein
MPTSKVEGKLITQLQAVTEDTNITIKYDKLREIIRVQIHNHLIEIHNRLSNYNIISLLCTYISIHGNETDRLLIEKIKNINIL